MEQEKVFSMKLSKIYPLLTAKAERKGRTRQEVDEVICWLTGYDRAGLERQLSLDIDYGTFFREAPRMNPSCGKITGTVCGVRVEEIEDPLMRKIRYLDKLIDELAKGKPLEKLLPDFTGKRVLDLGCGYGWHCGYAAGHGAAYVLGTDLSEKMLETARIKNSAPAIQYRRSAMEELTFPAGSFDVVLSSLALHYVRDFGPLVENIFRWLTPGGAFVFSSEHPVFTAYGSQDWYYGPDGEILHFPVDNYYYEGERDAVFLGEHVVKYHRTLTTYLNTLLDCGFRLKRVVEPQPPEDMLDLPGMRDEMRRPMMLLVSAEKPR